MVRDTQAGNIGHMTAIEKTVSLLLYLKRLSQQSRVYSVEFEDGR
jgi:hypothetical protein